MKPIPQKHLVLQKMFVKCRQILMGAKIDRVESVCIAKSYKIKTKDRAVKLKSAGELHKLLCNYS